MNNVDIHQKLMDEVYSKWRQKECAHMSRLEVIDKFFDKKHKVAVQLGNLNYQVENGGFSQWFMNSYGDEDIDDLLEYFDEAIAMKIPYSKELYDILEAIKSEHMDIECPECEGEGSVDCSECDGEGKIECYECEGEGYIEDEEDDDKTITCSDCCGTGIVECEDCCGEGRVECETCKGDREVHIDYDGLEEFDDSYFNIDDEARFKCFIQMINNF